MNYSSIMKRNSAVIKFFLDYFIFLDYKIPVLGHFSTNVYKFRN
jgi:hypothetical protein